MDKSMVEIIKELITCKNMCMDKNIIIFGAGSAGKAIAKILSELQITNILCFVDNDSTKWGSSIEDIDIKSPALLTKRHVDNIVILISSMYYKEISEQLIEMGYIEEMNFFYALPIIDYYESIKTGIEKLSSETSRVRKALGKYCMGDGLDIGYGGDPINRTAICMDLPTPYVRYNSMPQHLHGDASCLYWFRDNSLNYVYSSHVLEDFIDTESVLSEWLRVIKPGGNLVLFLPDEQVYRSYCKSKGEPPNPYHIHDNFGLGYLKEIIKERKDIEIVHEKFPSNIYSFELVLRKK